ncbi:MAG: hypothetical protein F6J87_09855 [Spirulina sp. SIO3F2]|nr:hypothetical protein [Spirulina sp. SIO3F2]
MYFKPLTEEERRINQRIDEFNRAPYFEIFLIVSGVFCAFTALVLVGIF